MVLIEASKITDFTSRMLTLEGGAQTWESEVKVDRSALKKGWRGRAGTCREEQRLSWKSEMEQPQCF